MKKVSVPGKVIWAVDVLSEDPSVNLRAASVIRAWGKTQPLTVEPVFVLSSAQLYVHPDIFSQVVDNTQSDAKSKLDKLLKKVNLPNVLKPTFIASVDYSLRSAVNTLLDYGRRSKANLIVVSTQSKKGMSRFLFGSFTESLVARSEIPVLLVTPTSKPSPLKHVLFASDLSERAEAALKRLITDARNQNFAITIYNKIDYLTEYSEAIFAIPTYQEIVERDIRRRNEAVQRLVAMAERNQVKAFGIVDSKSNSVDPASAILKTAGKVKANAIAMSSHSGPVASALLGSVTRQVIRNAKCPVWIIHTKEKLSQSLTSSYKEKTAAFI